MPIKTNAIKWRNCAINGVLPTIITQVASYEVAEVLRYLSGEGFSKN